MCDDLSGCECGGMGNRSSSGFRGRKREGMIRLREKRLSERRNVVNLESVNVCPKLWRWLGIGWCDFPEKSGNVRGRTRPPGMKGVWVKEQTGKELECGSSFSAVWRWLGFF